MADRHTENLHTLARICRKLANGQYPSDADIRAVEMVEADYEQEIRASRPDPLQLRATLDFRGEHEARVNGHASAGV